MAFRDDEDSTVYVVLVNEEEQYSLWPKTRKVPAGWNAVGKEGTRAECSRYVDEVWKDMRPLSLRRRMAGSADTERPVESESNRPHVR